MLYVKDVFVYHSNIRVTDEKQKHLHELMNIHITSSAVGELTDASLTTPSCCVLVLWHLTEELELLFPAFFFLSVRLCAAFRWKPGLVCLMPHSLRTPIVCLVCFHSLSLSLHPSVTQYE